MAGSNKSTVIWIPCESFEVTLIAEDDGPTEMEKAVLLYLDTSDELTLRDVLDFLGLGERLAVDLLTGLWTLGYILIDASNGNVRLEPYWRGLVKKREWTKIDAGRQASEVVPLMRELVTGQILGEMSSPASPPPECAGPALVSATLAESVGRDELATIGLRNLRQQSPLHARVRKLRAEVPRLEPGLGGRGNGWLRLELEASVEVGQETGTSLNLHIVNSDDAALSRIGPKIERALTTWAQDNGDHPLVRELVANANRRSQTYRPGLVARIEGLSTAIQRGLAKPVENQVHVQEWRQQLEQLAVETKELEATQGRVALHFEKAASATFLGLAMTFERQLLLVAPSVDYDGLSRLNATLVKALNERPADASAILLWGDGKQKQLTDSSRELLDNAAVECGSADGRRLFFSERSSRIADAFAILDGRRLLYSNASPLKAAAATDEFVFTLDIVADAPSPLPRQALEIARERTPDFAIFERIEMRPWALRDEPSLPRSPPSVASVAPPPPGDDDSAILLKAYFHDLNQNCLSLADRASRAGNTVEILSGADLYQAALDITADVNPTTAEAVLWIGFGRDDLTREVAPLHRPLVQAVRERAKRGLTTVVLVAPQTREGGVNVDALRAIAAEKSEAVIIVETTGLRGHFICGEQRFLAASGGLASPPVVQSARLGGRLVGVAATDAALCSHFKQAHAERWPALRPQISSGAPRATKPATRRVLAINPQVSAWLNAEPGYRRAALWAAISETNDRIDDVIDALLDLSAEPSPHDASARDLHRDVLSLAAAHGSIASRGAALDALASAAWSEGRWQEAALLLEAGQRDSGPAPLALAVAAAAVDAGLKIPETPIGLERAEEDSWLAWVALACKAVLANGDATMADALEIKFVLGERPAHCEALGTIAQATLDYWQSTMEPIDATAIRAMARRGRADDELRELAKTFAEGFRYAADRRYPNSMVSRVAPRFYSDTSGLKTIVDRIGDDGAAPWPDLLKGLVEVLGSGPVDLRHKAEEFLEAAHDQFAWGSDEKIVRGRGLGGSVYETAQSVLRLALNLRNALQAALDGGHWTDRPEAAQLTAALQQQMPGLSDLSAALPAQSVARPILEDLRAWLIDTLEIRP